MTIENAIIEFLSRRRGRLYCDDCLTRELRRYQRVRVAAASHAIAMTVGFHRGTETCAGCGGTEDGTKAR